MKHAVISGGSSGIGKALARQLLTDGWSVSLLARRQATLAQAKTDLDALVTLPAQAVNIYSVDVADYDELIKVLAEAVAISGPPNLLVAAAGIAHPGYFKNVALEIHYQTMSTNYFGTLHLIKAALPYMEANGGGDMVLISSGAGLVGIFGYSPYSPSKFAVRGLAESLRRELKDSGIQIFVVYPPDTDTPQLIEERKTKPVETSRITESAKMSSADAVARSILAGVRKGRFVIAPGWEMFLLSAFHSLINPILQWHFDGLVTAVRKPRILQQNSTSIQTQLARFLIVGVAVVLFDMALFAVLSIVLRVNYLAANTLSFLLSMSLEYFISREWVFNKTEHQAAKDFTKFLIAGMACVAVANGILFVCMRYRLSDIVAIGLDYGTQLILAKVMSIVVVAGFDFWLKKAFVFKLN